MWNGQHRRLEPQFRRVTAMTTVRGFLWVKRGARRTAQFPQRLAIVKAGA